MNPDNSENESLKLLQKAAATLKGEEKTAVIYFSLTGNTEKAAKLIGNITDADCYRIKSLNLPKFAWLFLSLVPPIIWRFVRIPITIEPALKLTDYRNIALGFPKWGFTCPPIASFIKKEKFQGKQVLPFMTYGGWDYERFYNKMCSTIKKKGAAIPMKLLIKRNTI